MSTYSTTEQAYRWLRPLSEHEQRVAMATLQARLDEDRRERDAARSPGIEPEFYCVSGKLAEFGPEYAEPSECVLECAPEPSVVVVVDGYAVVRRRYAVIYLVGDGPTPDDGVSTEIEWFDDRAKAEEFAARTDEPVSTTEEQPT